MAIPGVIKHTLVLQPRNPYLGNDPKAGKTSILTCTPMYIGFSDRLKLAITHLLLNFLAKTQWKN
jgi:hypothetical protein